MVDLSIIIVNWNTRELLRDCLASIFATAGDVSGRMIEVFVVDNNSSDGSTEMVREQFPQVRLIENQENAGFAVANNQVFPLCSADYVLLLNPDTRVLGDALSVLLTFMKEHPDTGAIGPKIVHPEMRLRVLSCGYQPTVRTIFNQYFFLSSLFPTSRAFRGTNLIIGVHDSQVEPVEWLSGACLLVRKQVIEQVGPLSEEWFMYAEDMEWCHRIAASGWKLYHVPTAVIEHYTNASSDQNKAVAVTWVRNLRSYFVSREHPSRLKLFLFDCVLVSGMFMRAIIYWARSIIDHQRRAMWQAEARKFLAYAATSVQCFKKNG